MILIQVVNININVIQINNDQNVKLFSKNFITTTLEACWYIEQSKKHHLVFKMAISDLKGYFLYIALLYLY